MGRTSSLLLSTGIVIGLALGGSFIGSGFKKMRTEDRLVSVKGFSEREVKSDIAFWTLQLKMANNNLSEGNSAIDSAKEKVIRFLVRNGVKADEIVEKNVQVDDRQTNNFGASNQNGALRYVITKTFEVKSADVDNLLKISRMTDELIQAGVVMSTTRDWQGGGLIFGFTKLNDIKPEMLVEANANAKQAAIKFTKENGAKLGKMRRASQGLFSITDRDASLASSNEGGRNYSMNGSDPYKKVRVVVSIDYSIE